MQQSPSWEADSLSDGQEFYRIAWDWDVHYPVQNSPPSAPILSLINPLHTFPLNVLTIHFNIILPPKFSSCKRSLSLIFCSKTHRHQPPIPQVFTLQWPISYPVYRNTPIPVAARSNAWVCGHSLPGIAGSNPTRVVDVCLL
jgi:hypothetical protein